MYGIVYEHSRMGDDDVADVAMKIIIKVPVVCCIMYAYDLKDLKSPIKAPKAEPIGRQHILAGICGGRADLILAYLPLPLPLPLPL